MEFNEKNFKNNIPVYTGDEKNKKNKKSNNLNFRLDKYLIPIGILLLIFIFYMSKNNNKKVTFNLN